MPMPLPQYLSQRRHAQVWLLFCSSCRSADVGYTDATIPAPRRNSVYVCGTGSPLTARMAPERALQCRLVPQPDGFEPGVVLLARENATHQVPQACGQRWMGQCIGDGRLCIDPPFQRIASGLAARLVRVEKLAEMIDVRFAEPRIASQHTAELLELVRQPCTARIHCAVLCETFIDGHEAVLLTAVQQSLPISARAQAVLLEPRLQRRNVQV